MQKTGLNIELFDKSRGVFEYDTIVFSRGFSTEALKYALAARAANRRVVVDICDNMFALSDRVAFRRACNRLRQMIAIADAVTTPTAMMAEQLQSHLSGAEAETPFHVIPDALELIDPRVTTRRGHALIAGLEAFQREHSGALYCVWYGASVPGLSGFAHLDAAVRELERFSARHPVTLTVISDTRLRYWFGRRSWRIPTWYLPFETSSFGPALARHAVAVIPVRQNAYTSGKSINRAATAVMAGLGVVADAAPGYEELRPWIALGDWQAGLARYVECPPASDPALAAARRHLETCYGAEVIGQHWAKVLTEMAVD